MCIGYIGHIGVQFIKQLLYVFIHIFICSYN